jgi:hypothetical protein
MLFHISKLFQVKNDMIPVYEVVLLSQFNNYVDLFLYYPQSLYKWSKQPLSYWCTIDIFFIKSNFKMIHSQVTLLALQNIPKIQKLMLWMIVLRKKVWREYDKEDDNCPD